MLRTLKHTNLNLTPGTFSITKLHLTRYKNSISYLFTAQLKDITYPCTQFIHVTSQLHYTTNYTPVVK